MAPPSFVNCCLTTLATCSERLLRCMVFRQKLIPEMRRTRRSLKGSSAVFGLLEGNPEYQCWFCQPVLCGIW